MEQVLALHEKRDIQRSKYEPRPDPVRVPEDIPATRAMLERRRPGQRCLHCHDVYAATYRGLIETGKFSKDLIYTYPPPGNLGLQVDPERQHLIKNVLPDSSAVRAGIRAGDELTKVDGQRVLTVADLARVLELTPREARLPVELRRGGAPVRVTLELSGDWKKTADPSWRASTHFAGPNGGFWGVPLKPAEKRELGIPDEGLALKVNFFFNGHPGPKQAGLQHGDIVVDLDGRREHMTPRQLHCYLQLNRKYGDKVPLVVRRGGKEIKLILPMPERPPDWE
jgi:S1-C subfamily serine protease